MLQGISGTLNKEQQKQLRTVEKSADHLLSLINDVLDLSRIEAGRFEVYPSTFDVRDSISKTIHMVTPLAEEKGLHLDVEIDDGVANIHNDRRRFEQVLINLLNNAVKFTDRGTVTLKCSICMDHLVLTVVDTGIGIGFEDQKSLFQPFCQLNAGIDQRHESTGLGLAIARHLCEMMGGEISVASDLGVGSTFKFSLLTEAKPNT